MPHTCVASKVGGREGLCPPCPPISNTTMYGWMFLFNLHIIPPVYGSKIPLLHPSILQCYFSVGGKYSSYPCTEHIMDTWYTLFAYGFKLAFFQCHVFQLSMISNDV